VLKKYWSRDATSARRLSQLVLINNQATVMIGLYRTRRATLSAVDRETFCPLMRTMQSFIISPASAAGDSTAQHAAHLYWRQWCHTWQWGTVSAATWTAWFTALACQWRT